MDVSSYENVVTDMSGDFGGTKKIMMDEYVVGTKKTKAKKTNRPKNPLGSKKGDEVKLSYLSFDDDCEWVESKNNKYMADKDYYWIIVHI